jgi:hypothetical protein
VAGIVNHGAPDKMPRLYIVCLYHLQPSCSTPPAPQGRTPAYSSGVAVVPYVSHGQEQSCGWYRESWRKKVRPG